MDSGSSIRALKQKIMIEKGLSIEEQQLFFKEKSLEDDKLVKDYPLNNQETIHLIPKLEGGGYAGFKFPDINKTKEKGFGCSGPTYRTVCGGINVDTYCDQCKKYVIIPLGYSNTENKEYFDLGILRTKFLCTNCKQESKQEIALTSTSIKVLKNLSIL